MDSNRPIGVFDSGVGGLSVLREIRTLLPHEDLLYVADSAHAPYGDKHAGFVETRADAITRFLIELDAKAIVVACNTATGAAIATLRARYPLPIVGMEPAVKPAASASRSRVVGVLATSGTLASDKFSLLLGRIGNDVEVVVQPCPGLVEQVEAGDVAGAQARALLQRYVAPLLARGADTLVLGCTHFPFLRTLIEDIAGPSVSIIDPNPAVARELCRRLAGEDSLSHDTRHGLDRFWSSATPAQSTRAISALWGTPVEVAALPERYRHSSGQGPSA